MAFAQHHHRGHDHAHGHGDTPTPVQGGPADVSRRTGPGEDRTEVTRRLTSVLGLTAVFTLAEIVGGVVSGSLALLADAGHMFSDVAALALSLFAIRLARRPPTERRTYGYARFDILAALGNGATLLVVSGLIVVEAWQRVREPVEIDGPIMLGVAALGLLVNVVAAFVLHGHAHDNLNVRGAYLHILGDVLGSVGAIGAAVVIYTTGWLAADPLISALISLLILRSAWRLVRESGAILLDRVPEDVSVAEVERRLVAVAGVERVHDVHVWTVTTGLVAMSAHAVVPDLEAHPATLRRLGDEMAELGFGHVTIQLETGEPCVGEECGDHVPGREAELHAAH